MNNGERVSARRARRVTVSDTNSVAEGYPLLSRIPNSDPLPEQKSPESSSVQDRRPDEPKTTPPRFTVFLRRPVNICALGHGTSPYEQKTQQSSCIGFSTLPHPLHL